MKYLILILLVLPACNLFDGSKKDVLSPPTIHNHLSSLDEMRKISTDARESRINYAIDTIRGAAQRGVTSHILSTDAVGYRELKSKFKALGFKIVPDKECDKDPELNFCVLMVSWGYNEESK